MEERCWAYIDQNIYAVIGTTEFMNIDRQLLEELLGRDTLEISKKPTFFDGDFGEIALWNAVNLTLMKILYTNQFILNGQWTFS